MMSGGSSHVCRETNQANLRAHHAEQRDERRFTFTENYRALADYDQLCGFAPAWTRANCAGSKGNTLAKKPPRARCLAAVAQ
jgi:hypothetical protein